MKAVKTYSKQVSEYIKQLLLRGELNPGDKVNEVRIASALTISRAPVREALQMLVNEGLILSIPQVGKFIRDPSPKEIIDSYTIGGVLEGAAIASCAEVFTPDDLRLLEDLLHQMAELNPEAPDYAESFAHLDVDFHVQLLAKTDNKLMVEQARTVCQRLSKFLLFRHWPYAFSREQVVRRHRKLLDAVSTKSPEHIEQTIREHYRELGERMAVFGHEK